MTIEEREAFLADVHVGVLAVERPGQGPLAVPVWYQYEDGDVIVQTSAASIKAKHLADVDRATLTAQQESLPYKYVMVEGPVTIGSETRNPLSMPIRYLGEAMGTQYAEQNTGTDDTVIRLTPEQWFTVDYGKL